MLDFDPITALSRGVIGLGFLLAFLAYRLLAMEQKKTSPQQATIKAIYVYMLFSFSVTGLGLISELMRHKFSAPDASQQRAQFESEVRQRFDPILNFLDQAVLQSVRACTASARGAATNTNDLGGCNSAGRRGIDSGTLAESQIANLKKQIQDTIKSPEGKK